MAKHIIVYSVGGKRNAIREDHLKRIRSSVKTHEGEFLTGDKGRSYMDKYAKKYLGKDLKDSWRDTRVGGQT